jgi:hypothetical protein
VLDDSWLELHEADLSLLTGTAFRYYLPAFLLLAWREPRWSGELYLKSNLEMADERLDPLDRAQRDLIRAFLERSCCR